MFICNAQELYSSTVDAVLKYGVNTLQMSSRLMLCLCPPGGCETRERHPEESEACGGEEEARQGS